MTFVAVVSLISGRGDLGTKLYLPIAFFSAKAISKDEAVGINFPLALNSFKAISKDEAIGVNYRLGTLSSYPIFQQGMLLTTSLYAYTEYTNFIVNVNLLSERARLEGKVFLPNDLDILTPLKILFGRNCTQNINTLEIELASLPLIKSKPLTAERILMGLLLNAKNAGLNPDEIKISYWKPRPQVITDE